MSPKKTYHGLPADIVDEGVEYSRKSLGHDVYSANESGVSTHTDIPCSAGCIPDCQQSP
jgi:hypothetical protein